MISNFDLSLSSFRVKTSKVWKGKSKIEKSKGTNNFELKVKKVKFFKALKEYSAHFF